jgi:hypothetical protein
MRRAIVVAVLLGCGEPDAEPEPNTSGIDPSTSTSESSGEESTSAGSTSGLEPPGDPEYPSPEPVDAEGFCPAGTFGPITFDGEAWVCLPECGADQTCPAPSSGDAEPACATNPFSSNAPCETDDECTEEGERCGLIGEAQMGCLLPPSHCILRCDAELTCPDEMVCTPASVCAYR